MKVEIKNFGVDEAKTLSFDNDNLDNDNFVRVKLEDHNNDTEIECDFLIEDIMPAIIAFDAKRSRRLSEEQGL